MVNQKYCLQQDELARTCWQLREHEGDHVFETAAERQNNIIKKVTDNMNKLSTILEMQKALPLQQPKLQNDYALAAEFLNYTCRKLAAHDRKTWDKVSMYQFWRAQFSAFLTDHVMKLAGGKKDVNNPDNR